MKRMLATLVSIASPLLVSAVATAQPGIEFESPSVAVGDLLDMPSRELRRQMTGDTMSKARIDDDGIVNQGPVVWISAEPIYDTEVMLPDGRGPFSLRNAVSHQPGTLNFRFEDGDDTVGAFAELTDSGIRPFLVDFQRMPLDPDSGDVIEGIRVGKTVSSSLFWRFHDVEYSYAKPGARITRTAYHLRRPDGATIVPADITAALRQAVAEERVAFVFPPYISEERIRLVASDLYASIAQSDATRLARGSVVSVDSGVWIHGRLPGSPKFMLWMGNDGEASIIVGMSGACDSDGVLWDLVQSRARTAAVGSRGRESAPAFTIGSVRVFDPRTATLTTTPLVEPLVGREPIGAGVAYYMGDEDGPLPRITTELYQMVSTGPTHLIQRIDGRIRVLQRGGPRNGRFVASFMIGADGSVERESREDFTVTDEAPGLPGYLAEVSIQDLKLHGVGRAAVMSCTVMRSESDAELGEGLFAVMNGRMRPVLWTGMQVRFPGETAWLRVDEFSVAAVSPNAHFVLANLETSDGRRSAVRLAMPDPSSDVRPRTSLPDIGATQWFGKLGVVAAATRFGRELLEGVRLQADRWATVNVSRVPLDVLPSARKLGVSDSGDVWSGKDRQVVAINGSELRRFVSMALPDEAGGGKANYGSVSESLQPVAGVLRFEDVLRDGLGRALAIVEDDGLRAVLVEQAPAVGDPGFVVHSVAAEDPARYDSDVLAEHWALVTFEAGPNGAKKADLIDRWLVAKRGGTRLFDHDVAATAAPLLGWDDPDLAREFFLRVPSEYMPAESGVALYFSGGKLSDGDRVDGALLWLGVDGSARVATDDLDPEEIDHFGVVWSLSDDKKQKTVELATFDLASGATQLAQLGSEHALSKFYFDWKGKSASSASVSPEQRRIVSKPSSDGDIAWLVFDRSGTVEESGEVIFERGGPAPGMQGMKVAGKPRIVRVSKAGALVRCEVTTERGANGDAFWLLADGGAAPIAWPGMELYADDGTPTSLSRIEYQSSSLSGFFVTFEATSSVEGDAILRFDLGASRE